MELLYSSKQLYSIFDSVCVCMCATAMFYLLTLKKKSSSERDVQYLHTPLEAVGSHLLIKAAAFSSEK